MNMNDESPVRVDQVVFDAWFILFIIIGALETAGFIPPLADIFQPFLQSKLVYVSLFAFAATGFIDYVAKMLVRFNRDDIDQSFLEENATLPRVLLVIALSIYFIGVSVSVPMELYWWPSGDMDHLSAHDKITFVLLIIFQSAYGCYLIALLVYPDMYYNRRMTLFWGGLAFLLLGFYLPVYVYGYYYAPLYKAIGDFFTFILQLLIPAGFAYALWKLIPKIFKPLEPERPRLEFSAAGWLNLYVYPSLIALAVMIWITLFEKNIKEYHFALDFLKGIIPLRIMFLLVPPVNYINLAIGSATIIGFYALIGI